jgi:hypothetical protein
MQIIPLPEVEDSLDAWKKKKKQKKKEEDKEEEKDDTDA